MIARYASSITAAAVTTLALLYGMQSLIDLQPGAESEARTRMPTDWVKIPRKEPPPPPPQPLTREIFENAPVPPIAEMFGNGETEFSVNVPMPGYRPVYTSFENPSQPDGPLLNIVRVRPVYPGPAEARGISGWVDVRFDVLTNGQVANVLVIDSSHYVFEKAAINAAQRFRFRPPIVNGVPQVSTGIEYRFRFDMENN